jgi:hypothetical protein
MTILIDDAGYGDLLYGVVIGGYRPQTNEFFYDLIDVKYFQKPRFKKKTYLSEARKIARRLVDRMELEDEEIIALCRGDILDRAAEALSDIYGEDRIVRVQVQGRAQELIEAAYVDEIRNLGYEPIPERTEKWGKNFWHMFRWLKRNPDKLKYSKSGWPRLKRFKMFRG